MYTLPCSGNIDIVLPAASNLFAWQEPELPEDLFFLREDGSALLTTTAHEEHAHLTLDSAELDEAQNTVPWLAAMLRPDTPGVEETQVATD